MWDIMMLTMKSICLEGSKKVLRYCSHNARPLSQTPEIFRCINKYFHSNTSLKSRKDEDEKQVTIFDAAKNQKKEKETFLDVIHTYMNETQRRRGHVSFIYAALRYMDEFGVNEDLDVYKKILDTLPKGKFVAATLIEAEFMHYPREQQCIIDLLEKMENNGVIPDPETEQMVINICGKYSFPLRKLRRMAYWQTKFKNLNPWPMPRPLPLDPMELAKLAIRKIATVDVQNVITIFDAKDVDDSIDKTWIVSASSPDQEKLIAKHPKNVAAYVEGPFKVWISKASVDYFILRADVLKPRYEEEFDEDDVSNLNVSPWSRAKKQLASYRSIHEQDHQTIYGVCATGTSSKDSLLSWIRCLQPRNPALMSIPILFKFTRLTNEIQLIGSNEEQMETSRKISEPAAQNIDS